MKAEQVNHYLTWVDREIDRVETAAIGDLSALPVEERMSLRYEWDDVVDRYLAVVKAYDARAFPRTSTARLADVSARLAALAPALERMQLRRPDQAVLARLSMARAS
jgi:hypothetical protein